MVTSVDGNLTALLSAHSRSACRSRSSSSAPRSRRESYLPRLAKGAISAFALTEMDVGSDPAAHEHHAEPTADGKPTSSTARSSGAPTARSPS